MYQTMVFTDRWACNCGTPDVPVADVRMSETDAATQARRHADRHDNHQVGFSKWVDAR